MAYMTDALTLISCQRLHIPPAPSAPVTGTLHRSRPAGCRGEGGDGGGYQGAALAKPPGDQAAAALKGWACSVLACRGDGVFEAGAGPISLDKGCWPRWLDGLLQLGRRAVTCVGLYGGFNCGHDAADPSAALWACLPPNNTGSSLLPQLHFGSVPPLLRHSHHLQPCGALLPPAGLPLGLLQQEPPPRLLHVCCGAQGCQVQGQVGCQVDQVAGCGS